MITYEVELTTLTPTPVAMVRGRVAVDELPRFLGSAFSDVMRAMGTQGIAPAGPPFGRYHHLDEGFDVEAGFPITGGFEAVGRVVPEVLPGGAVATVLHRGAYHDVANAYEAAVRWIGEHGYEANGIPWESYLDGPDVAEPRTVVHVPCRRMTTG